MVISFNSIINRLFIEKESFFKSFLLFFIVIEIFLSIIFYNDAKIQKEHLEEDIFLKMKNYSYFFDGDEFDIDIIAKNNQPLYELKEDDKHLYILININNQEKSILKIIYPKTKYNNSLKLIYEDLFLHFFIFSMISFFISFLFTYYSLYPLQKSYLVLKEFMKDIIHDINTPISAMKLNISLIDDKTEEINSISYSINTLEMLHKNLDNYTNEIIVNLQQCNIKAIINEQYSFFSTLYEYIQWDIDIQDDLILTDKDMLSRVIYNLLNNACKYNISNGFINISYKNKQLIIENSSYGIKNINNVFKRFYKESNRGLGIGLHIVSKLLNQLKVKYKMTIDKNNKVTIILTFK